MFPIREQIVKGLTISTAHGVASDEAYEMFPHDLANDLGTATMSSLQIGTISTE